MSGPDKKSTTRFGKELSAQLKARRLRPTDISQDLGVSVSYVSGLTTGAKNASAQTADRIADVIGAADEERVRLHRAAAVDAGFRLDLPDDF